MHLLNYVQYSECYFFFLYKIFVVMQKMKGDMLEMILNSPKGRLTERQTKFIVHQVKRISLMQLFMLSSLLCGYCSYNSRYFSQERYTKTDLNPLSICTSNLVIMRET